MFPQEIQLFFAESSMSANQGFLLYPFLYGLWRPQFFWIIIIFLHFRISNGCFVYRMRINREKPRVKIIFHLFINNKMLRIWNRKKNERARAGLNGGSWRNIITIDAPPWLSPPSHHHNHHIGANNVTQISKLIKIIYTYKKYYYPCLILACSWKIIYLYILLYTLYIRVYINWICFIIFLYIINKFIHKYTLAYIFSVSLSLLPYLCKLWTT